MRTLPWLDGGKGNENANTLKRKRNQRSDIQTPEPAEKETAELAESSDSDIAETLDSSSDNSMIGGYDNDDAYIMVEHDLLEAAKQVTRHIHLEAYHKHATAPVTGKIVRPTTEAPKRKPQIEGSSDEEEEGKGKDPSTLGELLRRRPTATLVAATPIKREEKSPEQAKISRVGLQKETQQKIRGREGIVSGQRGSEIKMLKEETKGAETDDEEDEDDEDLDRPHKVSPLNTSTNISRLRKSPLVWYALHQTHLYERQLGHFQPLAPQPNYPHQKRHSTQIGYLTPSGIMKNVPPDLRSAIKSA
jgi:hypothetical protein